MVEEVLKKAPAAMEKAVEFLRGELTSLRTGRAHATLVEDIRVDYYGQDAPIKQVASINTPDPKTILITPWDKSVLGAVEKAIRSNANLGLNPVNDGSVIRVAIPALTGERRAEIIKQMKEKIEQCHISLRNIRHELLGEVKNLQKNKQATEDDLGYVENKLGKLMEDYKQKINKMEADKEQELKEI